MNNNALACTAAHTSVSGQTNKQTVFEHNTYILGLVDFAIEVGDFASGAIPPDGTKITNNSITLTHDSIAGAISFSNVTSCVATGNTINAAGHTWSIAGIELVAAAGCTLNTNTISGTPASGGDYSAITANGSNGSAILGNILSAGIFWGNGSGTTNKTNNNSTIQGNVINPTAGSTFTTGLIHTQCNISGGCQVSNNIITGNTLNSTGSTVPGGIAMENDYNPGNDGLGVMRTNTVAGNTYIGTFSSGNVFTGGTVTNTLYDGMVTVTGNGVANFTVDTTAHITASTPTTDAMALSNNATLGQTCIFTARYGLGSAVEFRRRWKLHWQRRRCQR